MNEKPSSQIVNISQDVINDVIVPESQEIDKRIVRAKGKIEKLSEIKQEIEETAKRYARFPSQVLVGIAGGVAGGVAGFAVPVIEGLLIVSGPLGIAIGAAVSIIGFRQAQSLLTQETRSDKLKSMLKNFEERTKSIRKEIEEIEAFLINHKEAFANPEINEAIVTTWKFREESIKELWECYRDVVKEQNKLMNELYS